MSLLLKITFISKLLLYLSIVPLHWAVTHSICYRKCPRTIEEWKAQLFYQTSVTLFVNKTYFFLKVLVPCWKVVLRFFVFRFWLNLNQFFVWIFKKVWKNFSSISSLYFGESWEKEVRVKEEKSPRTNTRKKYVFLISSNWNFWSIWTGH